VGLKEKREPLRNEASTVHMKQINYRKPAVTGHLEMEAKANKVDRLSSPNQ
jgi:hypothetical protein